MIKRILITAFFAILILIVGYFILNETNNNAKLDKIEEILKIYNKLPDSVFVSCNKEFLDQDIQRNKLSKFLNDKEIARLKKIIQDAEIIGIAGNKLLGITFTMKEKISALNIYKKDIYMLVYCEENAKLCPICENINENDITIYEMVRPNLYELNYSEAVSWKL